MVGRRLLRIRCLAPFEQQGLPSRDVRLPGRCAHVLQTQGIREHGLDVLERLAGGFGEEEEDVQEHGDAEDAEDDVDLPLDVDKSGGHEVTEGEVEGPVGGGGEGNGFTADAKGVEFGGIDPLIGYGSQCLGL